jgi:hypothetical protein
MSTEHLTLSKRIKQPIENRFWSKVHKTEGCWIWLAFKNRDGYGRFGISTGERKYVCLAHRFAWIITIGPIPKGMNVLHRCDNPACCHPDHLFLGTQQDNVADQMAKGRKPKGEECFNATMSDEKVRHIKEALKDTTVTKASIARRFDVHYFTLTQIAYGKSWAHI